MRTKFTQDDLHVNSHNVRYFRVIMTQYDIIMTFLLVNISWMFNQYSRQVWMYDRKTLTTKCEIEFCPLTLWLSLATATTLLWRHKLLKYQLKLPIMLISEKSNGVSTIFS